MDPYAYEYDVPLVLPTSREKAFAALCGAGALESWFAECAEVEPRAGGDFRFWGKYTLGVPTKTAATQRLARFEPPSTLAFSWRFMGRDSEVTWSLAEAEGGVKITVRHVFDALPEGVRVKELIDDLWRLHTGNLGFYLIGDREIFRPDFNDPNPVVRHQIVINATPDKVFAALINPKYIKQWFPAPAPFVEPRVGGKYGFGYTFEKDGETFEPPPMTILDYIENRKLAITWPDWRGDPSVPDQSVTWLLENLGGRTRLTLVHSGFVRTTDVSDYPFGWIQFINKIKEVAARI